VILLQHLTLAHTHTALAKLKATNAELHELLEAMQAMQKYKREMRDIEVLMTQSMGKLGSHSKVNGKATQAVGAFVTTHLRYEHLACFPLSTRFSPTPPT
jgi:3-dehydroquinate dehydratase